MRSLRVILLLVLAACGSACLAQPTASSLAARPTYTGSKACESCHKNIYAGWSQTRMANVVRDPKVHPEAVLGDFSKPNPLVTFNLDEVSFVYGSRWKQRYFKRQGDDYYVLPAQWDILQKKWLPFHVEDNADWWTAYYPKNNEGRPTSALCDGCHSVNFNTATKAPTEWNVGCEKCHGPGSEHVAHPSKKNIVNPRSLDLVRGNDVCIQCHSQGRTLEAKIDGKYYDWPVGYEPGKRLVDYWRLEDIHLGKTDFYYFADGTAHKNRMQGNDFISSEMYHADVRCMDCHNVHSNRLESNLIAVGNELCLSCHTQDSPQGPHMTVAEHTHHAKGSAGSQCIACHMPKIEVTIPGQFVAAHTFRFITPKETELQGVPNACNTCHKDKSVEWSEKQLVGWSTVSPWRMMR